MGDGGQFFAVLQPWDANTTTWNSWVNGIQTADFFDVRAPNESGRNGYRAAPGVLSLQGHDPTTDLSFRNIRIVEMPKGP